MDSNYFLLVGQMNAFRLSDLVTFTPKVFGFNGAGNKEKKAMITEDPPPIPLSVEIRRTKL